MSSAEIPQIDDIIAWFHAHGVNVRYDIIPALGEPASLPTQAATSSWVTPAS